MAEERQQQQQRRANRQQERPSTFWQRLGGITTGLAAATGAILAGTTVVEEIGEQFQKWSHPRILHPARPEEGIPTPPVAERGISLSGWLLLLVVVPVLLLIIMMALVAIRYPELTFLVVVLLIAAVIFWFVSHSKKERAEAGAAAQILRTVAGEEEEGLNGLIKTHNYNFNEVIGLMRPLVDGPFARAGLNDALREDVFGHLPERHWARWAALGCFLIFCEALASLISIAFGGGSIPITRLILRLVLMLLGGIGGLLLKLLGAIWGFLLLTFVVFILIKVHRWITNNL